MRIDIVIVNCNAGHLLQECVESIIQYGEPFVSKIIIVDNDSSDGSLCFIEKYSQVKLIKAKKNLGFGRASNLGARYCESEFLLFLNPDTRIYADTLKNVLQFMSLDENRKVGICGVQLENKNGDIARSNSRFPSAGGLLSHSIGLTRLFPSLGSAMSEWDHSNTRLVDQVIGAFFLVRRQIFQQLEGFDERFFVYFEEVDFSFRSKHLGWHSAYFAGTQAFHIGGGISDQIKDKRLFYSLRSRIQYVCKHFSLSKIMLVLFVTIFIEPLTRIALCIANKSLVSIRETSSAYFMLYKWMFSQVLKK